MSQKTTAQPPKVNLSNKFVSASPFDQQGTKNSLKYINVPLDNWINFIADRVTSLERIEITEGVAATIYYDTEVRDKFLFMIVEYPQADLDRLYAPGSSIQIGSIIQSLRDEASQIIK